MFFTEMRIRVLTRTNRVAVIICTLVFCSTLDIQTTAIGSINESAVEVCAGTHDFWNEWSSSNISSNTLNTWVASVLQNCSYLVPAGLGGPALENSTVTIKSLLLPAWHNGLLYDWLGVGTGGLPALRSLDIPLPQFLPPPAQVSIANDVQGLAARQTVGFTAVQADVSGLALSDFLASPEYQNGRYSALLGFNNLDENSCALGSEPHGPLHPRTYLMLFYRRDVLAVLHAVGLAQSADPPHDWQTLLELLQAHASASASSAGSNTLALPQHGLCVTTHPYCGRLGDVFAAIAASVMQNNGTHQGYVLNLTQPPPAVDPLINGTGWRYAGKLLQQMLRYNAPEVTEYSNGSFIRLCDAVSPFFLSGDCLFTLDWDAALPSMASTALQKSGVLGVAPLPGSRLVVDRRYNGSGDLVACTAELCSASDNHDRLYLQQLTSAMSASVAAKLKGGNATASSSLSLYTLAREAQAVALLGNSSSASPSSSSYIINRAPYSVAYDLIVSVSYVGFSRNHNAVADITALQQIVLEQLDAYRERRQSFTDSLRQLLLGLSAAGITESQRCSSYADARWWEALAANGSLLNVTALKNASGLMDDVAVHAYLRALWHAIHHPNGAPDMQSPMRVNWFKYAASHAAYQLVPTAINGSSDAALSTALESSLELLLRLFQEASEAMGTSAVRSLYTTSISAAAWEPDGGRFDHGDPPTQLQPQETGALSTGALIATITSVSLTILMLITMVVLLVWYRRRRRHRGLLGRVLAPRVGPDTTLLITDIQNSTVLWEQLPSSVMDVSLKLHHGAIRKVLSEHNGYESATEGDSFIVAFADPAAAVAFATTCQVELLNLSWPPELLEHPDAAIVLVEPTDPRGSAAVHAPASLNLAQGGWRAQAQRSPHPHPQDKDRTPTGTFTRPSTLPQVDDCSPSPLQTDTYSGYGAFGSGASRSVSQATSSRVLSSLTGGAAPPSCAATLVAPRIAVHGPYSATHTQMGATDVLLPTTPAHAVNAVELAKICVAEALGSGFPASPSVALGSSPGRHSADRGGGSGGLLSRWWSAVREGRRASEPHGREAPPHGSGELLSALRLSGTFDGSVHGGPAETFSITSSSMHGAIHAAEVPWSGAAAWSWAEALGQSFPTVPSLFAVEMDCVNPFGCKRSAVPYMRLPSGRPALVVYRGLRVRMGLHTGLDDPQYIVFNKVGSSYKYYGPFAETAKVVSDVAQGGLITLSDAAFARLRNTMQRRSVAASIRAAREAVVVYAGHHILPGEIPTVVQRPASIKSPAALGESTAGTASPPNASPRSLSPRQSRRVGSLSSLEAGQRSRSREAAVERAAVPAMATEAAGAEDDPAGGSNRSRSGGPDKKLSQWTAGSLMVSAAPSAGSLLTRSAPGLPRQESGPQPRGLAAALQDAQDLDDDSPPRDVQLGQALFVAVPSTLLCRLSLSAPLRNTTMVQAGSLEAPVGCIAVGFMKVVGASTLLADLPGPAARALAQFQALVCSLLGSLGGYLVEGGDGLVLAVFGRPTAAVDWALTCVAELKKLDWEDELLAHELCAEELAFRGGMAVDQVPPTASELHRQQTAIHQGLRIKVGLAVGQVTHMLTQASGRLSYRGRVMNRAARVAGIAAAGQVMCTSALWDACQGCKDFTSRVAGVSMGRVALKGITHPVEVVQCHRV